MNFKIIYLFVFLSVFIFSDCTRTEDAPWDNGEVPVIYSLISPNNQIQIYLGKSYLKRDSIILKKYTDAKAFICGSDSVWLELRQLTDTSSVFVDNDKLFPVEMGKTYYIKIELADRTIHAQTTVPSEAGKIGDAQCIIPPVDNYLASVMINGKSYDACVGTLNVKCRLPANKSVGCYLSAFGNEVGNTPYLTTGSFQSQDFYLPKDFSTFTLNLITADANFKKFRIAQNIDGLQSPSGILSMLGSYGGVRPIFSNIQNGIGLFGSFVADSLIVHADIQPK